MACPTATLSEGSRYILLSSFLFNYDFKKSSDLINTEGRGFCMHSADSEMPLKKFILCLPKHHWHSLDYRQVWSSNMWPVMWPPLSMGSKVWVLLEIKYVVPFMAYPSSQLLCGSLDITLQVSFSAYAVCPLRAVTNKKDMLASSYSCMFSISSQKIFNVNSGKVTEAIRNFHAMDKAEESILCLGGIRMDVLWNWLLYELLRAGKSASRRIPKTASGVPKFREPLISI